MTTTILNIQESFKPQENEVKIFDSLKANMRVTENQLKKNPIYLSNVNFENGTYRIRTPGYYQITEDIFFNPNPSVWNSQTNRLEGPDWFPTSQQTSGGAAADYPVAPFGGYHLGFFSALTVETENVIIDLNGFTISQSIPHYLQQRFFSIIELASTPFIPPQGPSAFGPIKFCKNVKVKNGAFGLTSHSAIHGNNMTNVILENLTIFNFEQAGIALNGGETVILEDINVDNSSHNVFVNALYSQSRFVKSFLQTAIENGDPSIVIQGQTKTATNLLEELNTEMDSVYNDVVNNKTEVTSQLYRNPKGIIDGNIYGIILNVSGVAVNGFVTETSPSKRNNNVLVQNVSICELNSNAKEIVGLFNYDNGEELQTYGGLDVQLGPVGDVFRILEVTDENNFYSGNVLSNAQCYISKYKSQSGSTRANIEEYIYNTWIASSIAFNPPELKYVLGGDSMAHVMKGTIGLFLSGSQNTQLYNIVVQGIGNVGPLGNVSKSDGTTSPYIGNFTRGVAIVSSKSVKVLGIDVVNVYSETGTAHGIEFINDCDDINISNYHVENIKSCDYYKSGAYPNSKGLSKPIAGVKNVTNLSLNSL